MKCYRKAGLACTILTLLAGMVFAYSGGVSIPECTGAPGEGTCADCHDNLNTGGGSASITAPAGYEAGDTLDITVEVAHSGQTQWGFQITALDASNSPVGEMLVSDVDRTMKSTAVSGREYIKHTLDGTDTSKANATDWSFKWVAPASDAGQITFYLASVAGNQAVGPNGDYTYTTTHTMLLTNVTEIVGTGLPSAFSMSQNYPNPFNPSTTIEFSIPRRSSVEIAIYNVLGQEVKILHNGMLPAGAYRTEWNGTDANGTSVASGAYFCRMEAEAYSAVTKMVLLK